MVGSPALISGITSHASWLRAFQVRVIRPSVSVSAYAFTPLIGAGPVLCSRQPAASFQKWQPGPALTVALRHFDKLVMLSRTADAEQHSEAFQHCLDADVAVALASGAALAPFEFR